MPELVRYLVQPFLHCFFTITPALNVPKLYAPLAVVKLALYVFPMIDVHKIALVVKMGLSLFAPDKSVV
jgi:hypothetical protein